MDNTVFVEFKIMQYDFTFNHLFTGIVMMAYYPHLKVDRDFLFSRADVIEQVKDQTSVYLRDGEQKTPLRVVECDGSETLRVDADPKP